MSGRKFFIVSLNRVDLLTLGSLLLSCLGLLAAGGGLLSLAISLMLLAMLVDMLDKLLARRMHLESEFGKYLDSFCDVFTYLVLPAFILFQMGMRDQLSVGALFIFVAAGILRLSHFNATGTVEQEGIPYHVGLQVIWSQLLVVLAFPAWRWLGDVARYPLSVVLFVMAIFMIRNVRFPKPIRYVVQAITIISVALLFFYLHLEGILTP